MLYTKKLTDTATIPTRGSAMAAGLDLYYDHAPTVPATSTTVVTPGNRAVLNTGIAMAIPSGFYGQVAPRSGLAVKQGLEILAGVIDSDYRGEIMVAVLNSGQLPITFTHGDRVAQLVILPIYSVPPYEVAELPSFTERGEARFGSTGL